MNADDLGVLVGASLFAVVIAGAVTYQGNPKGRKWLCVLPLATCPVFMLGAPLVLGVLTGLGVVGIEVSRWGMGIACVATISVCSYFAYKYW